MDTQPQEATRWVRAKHAGAPEAPPLVGEAGPGCYGVAMSKRVPSLSAVIVGLVISVALMASAWAIVAAESDQQHDVVGRFSIDRLNPIGFSPLDAAVELVAV